MTPHPYTCAVICEMFLLCLHFALFTVFVVRCSKTVAMTAHFLKDVSRTTRLAVAAGSAVISHCSKRLLQDMKMTST